MIIFFKYQCISHKSTDLKGGGNFISFITLPFIIFNTKNVTFFPTCIAIGNKVVLNRYCMNDDSIDRMSEFEIRKHVLPGEPDKACVSQQKLWDTTPVQYNCSQTWKHRFPLLNASNIVVLTRATCYLKSRINHSHCRCRYAVNGKLMFLKYMPHISFWSRNVGVLRLKTVYIYIYNSLGLNLLPTPPLQLDLYVVPGGCHGSWGSLYCIVLFTSRRWITGALVNPQSSSTSIWSESPRCCISLPRVVKVTGCHT